MKAMLSMPSPPLPSRSLEAYSYAFSSSEYGRNGDNGSEASSTAKLSVDMDQLLSYSNLMDNPLSLNTSEIMAQMDPELMQFHILSPESPVFNPYYQSLLESNLVLDAAPADAIDNNTLQSLIASISSPQHSLDAASPLVFHPQSDMVHLRRDSTVSLLSGADTTFTDMSPSNTFTTFDCFPDGLVNLGSPRVPLMEETSHFFYTEAIKKEAAAQAFYSFTQGLAVDVSSQEHHRMVSAATAEFAPAPASPYMIQSMSPSLAPSPSYMEEEPVMTPTVIATTSPSVPSVSNRGSTKSRSNPKTKRPKSLTSPKYRASSDTDETDLEPAYPSPTAGAAVAPASFAATTPATTKKPRARTSSATSPAFATGGRVNKFACPWPGCDKAFPRQYNLKSHTFCHSGARPHECPQCGSAFARKHDLQRHVRTLHAPERPFRCGNCSQSFTQQDQLRRHEIQERQQLQGSGVLKAVGASSGCVFSGKRKSAAGEGEDEEYEA